MNTVFLNIGYMKYYRGINKDDIEINGSEDAFDQFNFCMANIDEEEVVIGYADIGKESKGLPLDRFDNEGEYAQGITALWVAENKAGKLVVVGWYKDATIYKNYCSCTFESDDAVCGYEQLFNVEGYAQNCVLLPEEERNKPCWLVLESEIENLEKHHNVWYGTCKRIEDAVGAYNGENLMYF